MTSVRAACPICGPVDLPPSAFTLAVRVDPCAGLYTFICPGCAVTVTKHACEQVVGLLVGAGVRATVLTVPAEALETRCGPPLGYDDLLDFCQALASRRMLAPVALAELTRR